MGKAKFANAEEAKAFVSTKKGELKTAKEELRAFEKENKLEKGGDHSGHEKHGKKWSKMNKVVESLRAEIEAAENWAKENKPKKEKTPRAVKYEYPKECVTEADRKKYRAKMRAQAKSEQKKAEKGEAGESKKSKKKKEAEAEEAPKKKKATIED